jgi:D-tyrosyl-tRNA(Tyr) deacylase
MRIIIQRVSKASVSIGGRLHSQIGKGLLVLLGIAKEDSGADVDYLVAKLCSLRIFRTPKKK